MKIKYICERAKNKTCIFSSQCSHGYPHPVELGCIYTRISGCLMVEGVCLKRIGDEKIEKCVPTNKITNIIHKFLVWATQKNLDKKYKIIDWLLKILYV